MIPQAHYARAEALLAEAQEVGAKIRALNAERKQFNTDDLGGRRDYDAVTRKMDEQGKKAMGIYAQAQVHATLSRAPLALVASVIRSVCGDCEEPIYRYQGGPWLHQVSGVPRCYRDPHTETAYPDPDVAIDGFTSPVSWGEVRVDGIAVEGHEFGPHDLVAHLDRSDSGSWVDFCNCGQRFTGADEESAHRLHREHRERECR